MMGGHRFPSLVRLIAFSPSASRPLQQPNPASGGQPPMRGSFCSVRLPTTLWRRVPRMLRQRYGQPWAAQCQTGWRPNGRAADRALQPVGAATMEIIGWITGVSNRSWIGIDQQLSHWTAGVFALWPLHRRCPRLGARAVVPGPVPAGIPSPGLHGESCARGSVWR